MSITDQIERIQGEVTSQTDLIEQIKTALAGKGGSSQVDTSVVTAVAGDVLKDKVIVDADGNPVVGTMADHSGKSMPAGGWSFNDTGVNFNINNSGFYCGVSDSEGTGKHPSYISASYEMMGLTPEKIAEGETVLGVPGTHKGGTDIQTCEVWFCKTSTATGAGIFGYGVTQLIDGVITSNTVMESARTQWIVPNVVCGSVVAMCSSVPSGNVILLNGSQDGATYMSSDTLGYSLIKLPNTPGTHVIELTAL